MFKNSFFIIILFSFCLTLGGCGSSKSSVPAASVPLLPTAASLSSSCTTATVGTAYSCTITDTGGKSPFQWTATGLPAGLTSNASTDSGSTLTISGTPQPAAAARASTRAAAVPRSSSTSSVQVSVADANGKTASLTFGITVSTPPALAISTTALPGGTAGGAYSATVTATGGTTPYTWTATGLPTGLNLTSGTPSATISGTTDDIGTSSVQVTVTDSESPVASVSTTLSLVIAQAAVLAISTTSLPNGTENSAYSQTLSATGGLTPYSWTLTTGALPTGLKLSTAGVISGTPTATGSFSFSVTVADSESPPQTATASLGITINSPASGFNITTSSPLPGATLNTLYTTTVTASGGTPPYTFALGTGSVLPAGLSLTTGSPSATISGTPTTTGTVQFTVDVQDSESTPATASASFLVTVTGSSSFTCPATPNPLQSLCGANLFEVEGVRGSGAQTVFAVAFLADNSGNVISGEKFGNDTGNGYTTSTITGGSYAMDSNSDGRGVLTITDSTAAATTFRFVNYSEANYKPGPIEEFDSTGTLASGLIFGVGTNAAVPQIPASTVVGVQLIGVNASGQKVGLLGDFEVGSNGCDGSAGSFSSQTGETIVVNSGGTVTTGLTATGSCTAADANGVGTAQITLSGGTPFTSNTLNFKYAEFTSGGTLGVAFLLGANSVGANQPILAGTVLENSTPGQITNSLFAGYCGGTSHGGKGACVALEDGLGASASPIEALVRFVTTAGSGNSGTVSGVIDENAAGTITTAGTWAYSAYTVDSNGAGTFTGSGKTIHFIYTDQGLFSLDESSQVRTGTFDQQNSIEIKSPGSPYVFGGASGVGSNSTLFVGFVTPTGTDATGTLPGLVDVISSGGTSAGVTASGTYASIDSTTGRGVGTATFTNGSSVNTVIYAVRARRFAILDAQSAKPFLLDVGLQ